MGMQAELRGGLSLGLSGFTFWSHDIGGFTKRTPENLYRRWLPFGVLSSHTRCHGQPPKEPWDYGDDFQNYFRDVVNMRYQLMPYIYAQSKMAADKGLPMVRALFVEFPNDKGAWTVDNEYMFGSDILVAPLFEGDSKQRSVYLPQGQWIDYQTNKSYSSGWQTIDADKIEAIILVRDGAVIPHIKLAQSTKDLDWSNIDLVTYTTGNDAKGSFCLPNDNILRGVSVSKKGKIFSLNNSDLPKTVSFKVKNFQ